MERASHRRSPWGSWCLRHRGGARVCGRRRTAGSRLTRRGARRKKDGAEADWFVAAVRAAFGVMRRPAGWILKKADGADVPLLAEIEPMPRAARNAKQIAGFDRDGDDGSFARTNMKDAAALDDETDFVFVVPVLGIETVEHGFEAGSLRGDVDDVGGDVAALGLQAFDLRGVCEEDFRRGGIG